MKTKVYFNDLQERSQRVLISQELASQNNGTMPAVNNLTIGPSPYADEPDCQLITADTEIGTWLLVWDASDKEFTTIMKENQK